MGSSFGLLLLRLVMNSVHNQSRIAESSESIPLVSLFVDVEDVDW